jgi:hypothetical protein
MNEILHANIFFFIASAATIIFCLLISVILYQLLKIIRSIRTIVERIEAGSELIAEDLAAAREYVQSGGIFTRALGFIMKSRFGGSRRRDEDDE